MDLLPLTRVPFNYIVDLNTLRPFTDIVLFTTWGYIQSVNSIRIVRIQCR